MKFKEWIIESVAQNIMNQIKSSDPHALTAWGSKDFVSAGSSLQFDVKGPKFKGRVIITLNKATDSYIVTFGKTIKGNWKVEKKLKDITVDNLISVLDDYIG